MEELVESFNYKEINKSGARFDFKKALWINHLHLKNLESKRILDVFGIHEIIFFNDSNHISFKHEALSRNIFADGALSIAKLLNSKSPGMYSVQDFF